MISSRWRRRGPPFALGLALAIGGIGDAAKAQFYFRPFFHTYRYDLPPEDVEEAPRYASRRAVARILAREGFRLVGPLGRRGEQVVATGVDRDDGETRFFIDPYEGEIIRALPLDPPTRAEGPPGEDERFFPDAPRSSQKGAESGRPRRGTSRNAPPRQAPTAGLTRSEPRVGPPMALTPPASPPPSATAPNPPPAVGNPAREEARRGEPAAPAKPQEARQENAPQAAKPADVRPPEASAAETAKPATKPTAAPPARTTARTTGGSGRRAIVPPRAEGTTVVTPSTPGGGANSPKVGEAGPSKTPRSAAMPQ